MNGKWKGLVLLAALGALAGLAGCSHSCVPAGWYGAHSVAPPRQPPGAPPITHATTYDIPGGAPTAKPSSDQTCLVYPPNTLTTAPPAKVVKKGGQ